MPLAAIQARVTFALNSDQARSLDACTELLIAAKAKAVDTVKIETRIIISF